MDKVYLLSLDCGHEPPKYTAPDTRHAPRVMYCPKCDAIRQVVNVTEDPNYKPRRG